MSLVGSQLLIAYAASSHCQGECFKLVVVARDGTPLLAVLALISLVSLVVVGLLIFLVSRTGDGLVVVAIPGFPPESILFGLVIGFVVILAKRKH